MPEGKARRQWREQTAPVERCRQVVWVPWYHRGCSTARRVTRSKRTWVPHTIDPQHAENARATEDRGDTTQKNSAGGELVRVVGKKIERHIDSVSRRIRGQINDIDSRRQAPEDRHDLASIVSPREPGICVEHNHDADIQLG